MEPERLRVVVAEAGDAEGASAAIALARALRDAGAEVVHAGPARSAGQLAATVVQEDADALGLAGAAGELLPEVLRLAADAGADDVIGFVLGDADGEQPDGVRIFPPGTPPGDVLAWLQQVGAG